MLLGCLMVAQYGYIVSGTEFFFFFLVVYVVGVGGFVEGIGSEIVSDFIFSGDGYSFLRSEKILSVVFFPVTLCLWLFL
jgi:hypothetical protein